MSHTTEGKLLSSHAFSRWCNPELNRQIVVKSISMDDRSGESQTLSPGI